MPFLNTTTILVALAAFLGLVIIWQGVKYSMGGHKRRLSEGGTLAGNLGVGLLIVALGLVILLGGLASLYVFKDAITTFTTLK